MASTVRVEDSLHATLREIAAEERRPIGQVIEDAIQRYQKEKFWQGVQEDFARLRADPVAWKDYQDEVMLWDSTAGNGLENEEPYYTPEEEKEISEHYTRTYGG
jgi:hypothetical protein